MLLCIPEAVVVVLEVLLKVLEAGSKVLELVFNMEVVDGVRCVLWVLGVMLCQLFCMPFCVPLCILGAFDGRVRILEVLERCVMRWNSVLCEL